MNWDDLNRPADAGFREVVPEDLSWLPQPGDYSPRANILVVSVKNKITQFVTRELRCKGEGAWVQQYEPVEGTMCTVVRFSNSASADVFETHVMRNSTLCSDLALSRADF